MKNTKIKGFSLAELMIAMLVISVALAAAAPSITKTLSGGDAIWKASTDSTINKDGEKVVTEDAEQLYFNGPNIIVGSQRLHNLSGIKEYFKDAPDRSGFHFSPKTDKLVIFNNIANSSNANSFMTSSHLSFYNNENGKDIYAGRLAADRYNLALGIGALQSLVPDATRTDELHRGQYNTAIGQYALLTNSTGSYNTAFGYKALQGTPVGSDKSGRHASNSIAIGDNALRNSVGTNNIAIGSHAGTHLEGDNNLVIGNGAGYRLTGSNNLLINTTVGFNPDDSTQYSNVKRLLIGHRGNGISLSQQKYPYITDDDNFSIGVLDYRMIRDKENKGLREYYRPPVIQGFTKTSTDCADGYCADGVKHAKGLIINANRFNVKDTSGKYTIFAINTVDFSKESTTDPLSLLKNLGSSVKSRKDAGTTTNEKNNYYKYLTEPLDISSAKIRPCNGAPICLAQFNVTTASYFTTNETPGFVTQNPHDKDKVINNYNKTSTFPVFKKVNENKTYLPDNPTFDLYIGSLFAEYDKNKEKYGFDAISSSDNNAKRDSKFESENDIGLSLSGFEFDNFTDKLIDVGKVQTNAGLSYTRLKKDQAVYQKSIPSVMKDDNTLKIRTVKTAVNFLEDFKETSGSIDRLRDVLKYDLTCIFKDKNACYSAEIDKNNSVWKRIKNGDCSLFDGSNLVKSLCCKANTVGQTQEDNCMNNLLPSDARLKNISGDNLAGLDEINKLNVVNYTYKADKAKTPHVGVIAQELKTVFPDAVKKGSDGYYRIRLEDMFYAMINSVKELSARKNDLETLTTDYIDTPLAELQKQNADIKAQNELIKQKNAEMEKRISKLETK